MPLLQRKRLVCSRALGSSDLYVSTRRSSVRTNFFQAVDFPPVPLSLDHHDMPFRFREGQRAALDGAARSLPKVIRFDDSVRDSPGESDMTTATASIAQPTPATTPARTPAK